MFRMLTTEVLWRGISGCSVVTYADGYVKVEPFVKEIHSTVFVPGPVAILESSKFDEFVIDDIEMISYNTGEGVDKKKLDDYLKSSGLYYRNGNDSNAVFLKIGRPCQIIPIS